MGYTPFNRNDDEFIKGLNAEKEKYIKMLEEHKKEAHNGVKDSNCPRCNQIQGWIDSSNY